MIGTITRAFGALALVAAFAVAGAAQTPPGQGFSALARVDMASSQIRDRGDALSVELGLTQGVPWRIFTLDGPPRAVLDFREVDWQGVDKVALMNSDGVTDLRYGTFRPGWSRLVIDLARPMALDRAGLKVDDGSGAAQLSARFVPASPERFAAVSGMPPDDPLWALPEGDMLPRPRARTDGPLVVVIDPGHGGIDPGAEREGLVEKDLMLTFARELREALIRATGIDVVLTRNDDSFVSLERRVAIAHERGADLFVSLHADVLPEGGAKGAVVHLLAETATDEASAKLAERHDRDDLLSGVDLTGKDDVVADVLMDLARLETQPRSTRVANALVDAMRKAEVPVNSHPVRAAGFSVLKAPDIPSVLIELGFLSNPRDRKNLADPAFRTRLAEAIRDGIQAWVVADTAASHLVRQ